MHRRLLRSLRVIAREWRTNDPQVSSEWVRLEFVSQRRGKRASSTRERSASEGPIL